MSPRRQNQKLNITLNYQAESYQVEGGRNATEPLCVSIFKLKKTKNHYISNILYFASFHGLGYYKRISVLHLSVRPPVTPRLPPLDS